MKPNRFSRFMSLLVAGALTLLNREPISIEIAGSHGGLPLHFHKPFGSEALAERLTGALFSADPSSVDPSCDVIRQASRLRIAM